RDYGKRKGLPETEDKTGVFAIPIYKKSLIKDYLQSENFPLQRFLYLGENFEDKMQIYITAQKQNGISETEFKKLAAEILNFLEAEEMKVEGFKHKVLSDKKNKNYKMSNFLIRFFLLLFMLFSAFVSKAQIIYNIDDFSDQYYAEIEFPSKGSLFVRGNATIKVIDKTTNQ